MEDEEDKTRIGHLPPGEAEHFDSESSRPNRIAARVRSIDLPEPAESAAATSEFLKAREEYRRKVTASKAQQSKRVTGPKPERQKVARAPAANPKEKPPQRAQGNSLSALAIPILLLLFACGVSFTIVRLKPFELPVLPEPPAQQMAEDVPSASPVLEQPPEVPRPIPAEPTPRAEKKTPADVVAMVRPAVVFLSWRWGSYERSGSGFRYGPGIVTNYHVVAGADSVEIRISDQESWKVERVLAYSANYDLAVLEQPIPVSPLQRAPVDIRQGDQVFVFGYPRGRVLGVDSVTVTQGMISAIRGGALQFDAAVSPGSSGGPIVNDDGAVVGVTVAMSTVANLANFGIPISRVDELLAQPNLRLLSELPPYPENR